MARKKPEPKPLSSLRFDFADAVENVCMQAMMLLQAVDTVLRHYDATENATLNPGVIEILTQRSAALRQALIGKED